MKNLSGTERKLYYLQKKQKKRLEQKRKSWAKNKDKYKEDRRVHHKIEKSITEVALKKRKQREKQSQIKLKERNRKRLYREKIKEATSDIQETQLNNEKRTPYNNRMAQWRALRKVKESLPSTPQKRATILSECTKDPNSPTVKILRDMNVITSPEEKVEHATNSAIIENLQEIISTTKKQRSKTAVTVMEVITTSVSSEKINKKQVSRSLGLSSKRLSRGKRHRATVLKTDAACWNFTNRKTRSDAINDDHKKIVYNFWTSPGISRPTGNKNDVKRMRTGRKQFVSHALYVLEKTQTEVYIEFKEMNPQIKISQRAFEKLKPFFVQHVRPKDKQTCCCRYHIEIRGMFRCCMEYRRKVLQTRPELVEEFKVYENLNELINDTLCSNSENNGQKLQCLQRNCEKCGIKTLKLMEEEKSRDENLPEVHWEKYEYVDVKRGSKVVRKLMLVKRKTNPYEMFTYFLQILSSFPYHQFSATWQSAQLRSLLDNLPQHHCVAINDYSESYRCFDRNEIQSGYFQKIEVSIHVSLLYRHAILEIDGVESTADDPVIIKEEFFVISEDDKRDHYFTHYVQKSIADYLQEINYSPKIMHEFNDGCAVQYKSRHCFGVLASTVSDLGYETMIRNFFETAHAKGAQDAAGGYIKREADLSVIRGRTVIQNGKDLYNFCEKNLRHPKSGSSNCKRRIFRYVEFIPRDVAQQFRSIADIRKVHSVRTTNEESEIVLTNLSCYTCEQCIDENYSSCQNLGIRGNTRRLKMTREVPSTHGEQILAETESLLDLITANTIVAVVADDDDADYYLMKVLGEPEILIDDFTDHWGITFPRGAKIIRGYYFDIVDKKKHLYKLVPKRTALNYAVSVKFILTESEIMASGKKIQLNEDIHLDILEALDEF
ncbi:uncharacterized protein LOC134261881 [Saccostrea cucullata]|uniref:uncharacterized protein LOC134261881 n=1 Tax=Saccostrea cuccullata TaxID=36930 RepID=UPI002ED393D9